MVKLQHLNPEKPKSARDATSIDLLIGQQIRRRREELGLRQDRLAQLINVATRQVQKYESGLNRISASRLILCAKALQVPVTWFFEHEPEPNDEPDLEAQYRLLPKDVREQLLAIAQVLLQKDRKSSHAAQ